MDEFKRRIVSKYQSEVNPTSSEEDWQQFLSYADGQLDEPKRRVLIWFWTGVFLLAAYLVSQVGIKGEPIGLDALEVPILSSSPSQMTDAHGLSLDISETEQSIQRSTDLDAAGTPAILSLDEPRHTDERRFSLLSKHLSKDLGGSNHVIVASTPPSKLPIAQHATNTSPFIDVLPPRNSAEILKPHIFPGVIPRWHKVSLGSSGTSVIDHLGPIITTQPTRLQSFMVELYAGVSFPSHDLIVEEQAYQFGGKLYYYLSTRLRSKINLQFSNTNFVSKTMEASLGVFPIASPSEDVTFTRAVVESLNFQSELGVDWMILRNSTWQPFLGVGYSASKELVKDVDYEFMGVEIDLPENDISVSTSSAEKKMSHLINLEAGCLFDTKYGGLTITLGYPYQIDQNSRKILNRLKVNVGLSHRF